MRKPTLKGPRVILRVPKLSDAPACVRWFNDPVINQYLGRQVKMTLKDEREYLKKMRREKNNYNYSVINESGKHIGMAGFKLFSNDKRVTFGITIGETNEWGKGYAQEITKLLINFAFRNLKINRFELGVFKPNKVAVHIYKKLGFKTEGHRRQYAYNKVSKQFDDDYLMAILREDWLKKKK
jgi:RimJ/RimL family protein N-acetyltransferase